jgi:hypothetical protein
MDHILCAYDSDAAESVGIEDVEDDGQLTSEEAALFVQCHDLLKSEMEGLRASTRRLLREASLLRAEVAGLDLVRIQAASFEARRSAARRSGGLRRGAKALEDEAFSGLKNGVRSVWPAASFWTCAANGPCLRSSRPL